MDVEQGIECSSLFSKTVSLEAYTFAILNHFHFALLSFYSVSPSLKSQKDERLLFILPLTDQVVASNPLLTQENLSGDIFFFPLF